MFLTATLRLEPEQNKCPKVWLASLLNALHAEANHVDAGKAVRDGRVDVVDLGDGDSAVARAATREADVLTLAWALGCRYGDGMWLRSARLLASAPRLRAQGPRCKAPAPKAQG